MSRLNALEHWLKQKASDQKTELRNVVLSAPTSKIAHEQIRRRGFRGSYDSVLGYRNQHKTNSIEAVGMTVTSFEQHLEKVSEAASSPLEAALSLSTEMNSLCLKLVSLLANYDWEAGGEPLNVRDALKLGTIVPSLSRASSGSLVELLRLRQEMAAEELMLGLIQEIRTDWQSITNEQPELNPIFNSAIKCTQARLGLDPARLLRGIK